MKKNNNPKVKRFKAWKLNTKCYGYLILPSLDNTKPWRKQRKKSTAMGHILTQQKKLSWMTYMFLKRLTKTVMWQFLTITKILQQDHTLPDIKTLCRTFFYSLKVLGMIYRLAWSKLQNFMDTKVFITNIDIEISLT